MPSKSSTKLTSGELYDKILSTAQSKYGEDVSEVYQYENGAVGVFLKSGKFRFVQGSDPKTLSKLSTSKLVLLHFRSIKDVSKTFKKFRDDV
jgi:hypothetical protein